MAPQLTELSTAVAERLRAGGRAYFFGNGGSAADAQHWAAELSGRFYLDRPALPAFALTANSSQVTAIGNDYGYAEIFARPLAGIVQPGDVTVGLSTSGNSENVVRGLEVAREHGALTVGFTGEGGGQMAAVCDALIAMPSTDTPRIQEGHALCGHLLCALVERALFGDKDA
ncbi:MAG: SIS domain-containing protein [Rhodothermaceae bacterium]|nr:SIS domain-containing protein [Rhodothermaceae bacterium]